ncbi:MAG TPA: DNA-3-methyladenine glycosylase [Verrucomicrobiae bacterium]|jgi:DNA-3-methyladenine glycosylase II
MTPEAVEYLCRADKSLARLIKKVGPCTMKPHRQRTPFVALVTAVTHQQLNGTAAKTILKRVLALYPGKRFPTPEDVLATPDDRLRTAGLSRAKVAAIKDIAAKTVAGVVPGSRVITKLSNEEILERLTSVRGVGPWTVEMLLMFTLGRTDVLPATDYGVRKGFALAFGWKDLPTPKELLEYGERWRPHRSTAAWYLWRALELPTA